MSSDHTVTEDQPVIAAADIVLDLPDEEEVEIEADDMAPDSTAESGTYNVMIISLIRLKLQVLNCGTNFPF